MCYCCRIILMSRLVNAILSYPWLTWTVHHISPNPSLLRNTRKFYCLKVDAEHHLSFHLSNTMFLDFHAQSLVVPEYLSVKLHAALLAYTGNIKIVIVQYESLWGYSSADKDYLLLLEEFVFVPVMDAVTVGAILEFERPEWASSHV